MIHKKYKLLLLLLFYGINICGQLPSDFRNEQIFLRVLNNVCVAGDSVDVEGIVACIADERERPYSKYVYVELINESDSVTLRQKVACDELGYFFTKVQVDPLVQSGTCYIRAYTNLMRNFSERSFAVQPLFVNKEIQKGTGRSNDIRFAVVPSGGKLIAGCDKMQSVTVFLSDGEGNPISSQKLDLIDGDRNVLFSTMTSQSGLAVVWVNPKIEEKYRLSCVVGNERKIFLMPDVYASGMKLFGKLGDRVLIYEIANAPSALDGYRLYLYDRKNGISVADELTSSGKLALQNPANVVSMFLVDDNKNIVAETTLLKKQINNVGIYCSDTVKVEECVDFKLENNVEKPDSIIARLVPFDTYRISHAESALLYESDFSSPIPFPLSFFMESANDRVKDLQAWLATATFKRFDISNAALKGTSIYSYMPEMTMSFSGSVENEMKRPMKGGTLVAYNMSNDFVYDAPIDSLGRFTIGVDDFNDGTKFFLQAINAKGKAVDAKIQVANATFPPVDIPSLDMIGNMSYTIDTNAKIEWKRHQLPDVVVEARLQKEKPKPTNQFYGVNYVDREKIEQHNYPTLLEIIRSMPEVQVIERESSNGGMGGYIIKSRRGVSILNQNKDTSNGLPIIWDGVKLDWREYGNLLKTPAVELEEVEILRPWQTLQYASGCVDGAVFVKTRSYNAASKTPSKGTVYIPMGLSVYPQTPQNLVAKKEGVYRLLVDVICKDKIFSLEKLITAVK